MDFNSLYFRPHSGFHKAEDNIYRYNQYIPVGGVDITDELKVIMDTIESRDSDGSDFSSISSIRCCCQCIMAVHRVSTRSQAVARIADRTASQQTLVPN